MAQFTETADRRRTHEEPTLRPTTYQKLSIDRCLLLAARSFNRASYIWTDDHGSTAGLSKRHRAPGVFGNRVRDQRTKSSGEAPRGQPDDRGRTLYSRGGAEYQRQQC